MGAVLAAAGWLAAAVAPAAAEPPPVRVLEAGGLPAEAAALLMSDQQGGLLTVEGIAVPVALSRGGRAVVEIVAEVQGSGILEGQPEEAVLQLFVYALDSGGGFGGSLLKVVELAGDEVRKRVAAGGVRFTAAMELAPGEYSVRLLVRNPATTDIGLRTLALLVPAAIGEAHALSPPLFPSPAGGWVEARAGEPPGGRWPTAAPSAWPVLPPEGEVAFEIVAYGFRRGSRLQLEVQPQTAGAEGERIDLPIRDVETPARGWSLIRTAIDGERLGPGNHLARVALSYTTAQRSDVPGSRGVELTQASAAIPLFVADTAAAAERGWAQLLAGAGVAAASGDAEEVSKKSRLQIPFDELDEGVRRALEELSDGRPRRAARHLSALQARALGGSGSAVETLQKAELRILRTLADGDPRVLAPVLGLYADLYTSELAGGRRLLSTHSRMLLGRLSDLYVALGSDEAARRIAASALVRVGAASGSALSGVGERLFEQALELDPDNEAALMCLASGLEKRGELGRAIPLFRRLLESRPGHPEARLRLAVNLRRTGSLADARQLLTGLSSAGEDGWIRSLAFQEMAAAELEGGDAAAAEQTLRRGLEALPGDEKLRLLLAFVLDDQRRWQAATEVLAGLGPATEPSPRHLYGQEPEALVRRLTADTAADVAARLPALKTALAAQKAQS